MTSTEIKDNINADITSKTAPNSISRSDVSTNLVDIVDYVDQQTGKKAILLLSYDSGTGTFTVNKVKDDFNLDYTFATTGTVNRIQLTTSGNLFTNDNKNIVPPSLYNNGGQPFFVMPSGYLTATLRQFNFIKFDGTSSSLPSFSNLIITIETHP